MWHAKRAKLCNGKMGGSKKEKAGTSVAFYFPAAGKLRRKRNPGKTDALQTVNRSVSPDGQLAPWPSRTDFLSGVDVCC